jgi:hypothetical protein
MYSGKIAVPPGGGGIRKIKQCPKIQNIYIISKISASHFRFHYSEVFTVCSWMRRVKQNLIITNTKYVHIWFLKFNLSS